MSRQNERPRMTRFFRLGGAVSLLATMCGGAMGLLLSSGIARAGERQFLVILATSPKQYPNPDRDPLGRPTGGLINRQAIFNQYFDTANDDIGSFAEYWEEISYGDVTISGNVADWINLQWAIQPPLLDPTEDDDINPSDEDLDNNESRNSPANFYDLNRSGQYEYGQGEQFDNYSASTRIDIDGDPNRQDNGPTVLGPGSFHHTESPFFWPVWKPGERFVDMDDDGKWDGLDEANNRMDWLPRGSPDGVPDLLGPWFDLNGDGAADNAGDCIYLADSDNDRKPDCCPNGPGYPGCASYDPDAALSPSYLPSCPPTTWTGPRGEVTDCNGNLIPDACDLSCESTACRRTGWLDDPLFIDTGDPCTGNADCDTELGYGCDPATDTCRLCGASRDDLPWTGSGGACRPTVNNIPDECEFALLAYPTPGNACVEEEIDDTHPCFLVGITVPCIRQIPARIDSLAQRCEYDDSNNSEELDIVEPFENFLRRWDPCIIAPEASPDNQESVTAHWVKVYDPSSSWCQDPEDPEGEQFFGNLAEGCPLEVSTFNYCKPDYIRDNYPARGKMCRDTGVSCEVCSVTGFPCQNDADCRPDLCASSGVFCQSDADCPGSGETCGEICLQCGANDVCRSGVEELIEEAGGRTIFGSHDPDGKIEEAGELCVCPTMSCQSMSDCTALSDYSQVNSICAGMETCRRNTDCASGQCINPDGSVDGSDNKYCVGEMFCSCVDISLPGQDVIPNACIAGQHVEFNPPDRWFDRVAINGPDRTEVYTTKMRPAGDERGDDSFIPSTVTPKPGSYISPDSHQPIDEPWYEQAWEDRYNAASCLNPDLFVANPPPNTLFFAPCECELGGFDPLQPEGPGNVRRGHCDPPPWPGENNPDLFENVRPFVPFDDVDPDVYDPIVNRRFFKANAGGLNGNGTGWIGCDADIDPIVVFETGDLNDTGFEEACDAPILPEEVDGAGEPGIFYDGWVEHDDLASSKYHRAGDQRLGEVTSPFASTYRFQPPSADPTNPSDPIDVAMIWGEDRGIHVRPSDVQRDGILVAAGPYAQHIHGNHHRDAGNLLTTEVLTWRREPPFNSGAAWELDFLGIDGTMRIHPYAGTFAGPNLGFRDYNLDGLLDQGECRYPGSENYLSDSVIATSNDGVQSRYPFNRNRIIEDCIEALDEVIDFDDWVDSVTLDRMTCDPGSGSSSERREPIMSHLLDLNNPSASTNSVRVEGMLSGVVLLPFGATAGEGPGHDPSFVPIHNEDNDNPSSSFPAASREISWNLLFHNLVMTLPITPAGNLTLPGDNLRTVGVAHHYLRTWERFPDLYDYDIFEPPPQPPINCPVGDWDIMADADYMVHPAPILKETPCTEWIAPIDLTTVLTPGVAKTLTLPRAEFVRDSYYFLENENRLGERFYFWSAGSGFDTPTPDSGLPGAGMLIMHTDVGSNPEALPPLNVTGTRYTYQIVQADGLGELDLCGNEGDDGDPWPGSSDARQFNFTTNPAARWYAQNSWTGLQILDIRPDGHGSTAVDIKWRPTSIPSLSFINPPGGVSVPGSGGVERYPVNFDATDVYGGTTINIYYIRDEKVCSISGTVCTDDSACPAHEFCKYETLIGTNLVGSLEKITPGTNDLSVNWNIANIANGRYVVFAELIPHEGSDGFERPVTIPRKGRNNVGDGTLTFGTCVADGRSCNADADCPSGACLIPSDAVNIVGHKARSETWTVTCVDANDQTWTVYSNLTQRTPNALAPGDPLPYPLARTGQTYTSVGGEVKFTINAGTAPFVRGDTFTFITTGKTAASGSVTIQDGKVKQDPTARITASPLSGDPPLEVRFDGRGSIDPNGEALNYLWNFGDGTATSTNSRPTHTFQKAGLFTVVLRVTNPSNARFGEAAVDIDVTNNPPNAVVTASPTSGPSSSECEELGFCSLMVQFSATQSSDQEDEPGELTYAWNFGDGESANDALTPGTRYATTTHYYSRGEDGTLCTTSKPCEFTAILNVIDSGGKEDSDTIKIMVGNSFPVPSVTNTALQGPDPLTVVFNASNSFDPDPDDVLKIEWVWGDGTPNEVRGVGGVSGDGLVPHRYELPAGATSSSFQTKAIFRDFNAAGSPRGGQVVWGPVMVVVNAASVGASDPTACFHICAEAPCFETEPGVPGLDEQFVVDAGCSHDNPLGGHITSYAWNFGDGTTATGMLATHTYTEPGTYAITLTVADAEDPPNTTTTLRAVSVAEEGEVPGETDNEPPIAAFIVNPTSGFAKVTLFTFDASGSTDPDGPTTGLTYRWNFGDGTTAVGKIVTHTYQDVNPDGSGNYMVRVTVRDEDNASTEAIQLVGVADNEGNLAPFAYIATGPRSGTAPVTLTFDGRNSFDPNDDPLEFAWTFKKDGLPVDTLSGPLVTKLFEVPGTYTVELTVDDRRGGVATAGPETITITAPAVPSGQEQDSDADGVSNGDDLCPNTPAGEEVDEDGCPVEEPEPQPVPRLCGLGMLPSLLGSLLGLVAMMASRRRFWP